MKKKLPILMIVLFSFTLGFSILSITGNFNFALMNNISKSNTVLSSKADINRLWQANGTPICWEIGSQYSEDLCRDGSGGTIIAWVDARLGSDTNIYAQRVTSSGTTLWSGNGTVVCNQIGKQEGVKICGDGSGNSIIVWYDQRGADYDIYAQKLNSTGHPQWALNGIAICNATGQQSFPEICSDGTGGAYIAWVDYRGGLSDIYATHIYPNGTIYTGWDANGTAVCTATNNQKDIQICCTGGKVVIVWTDYRDVATSGHDIYAQKLNAMAGVDWLIANGTPICTELDDQEAPQICCYTTGTTIITWKDNRSNDFDTYAQKLSINGVIQWQNNGTAVCTEVGDQDTQVICCDGSGGAVIAWRDNRSGNTDIYAQKLTSTTGAGVWTANGTAICSAAGNQKYPDIQCDTSGGALIVWGDNRGATSDIYYQRIDSSGNIAFTVDGTSISTAPGSQYQPKILQDGIGGAVIVWQDARSGTTDIYAQRITSPETINQELLWTLILLMMMMQVDPLIILLFYMLVIQGIITL
ncbi:MAG: hypothetical protein ACTSRG_17325 [Candidatus Helarchaeota archaeon]